MIYFFSLHHPSWFYNKCEAITIHPTHSFKKARTLSVLFSGLLWYFFASVRTRKYCFFCIFICKNWHIWWLNRHPFSLKGAATCFLMGFHAILRQILKYRFCAIPLREISVRAFFSLFTTRILLWLSYQEAYHHPLFSNWRMFFDIPNIFNKFWFFTYFDDVLHFAFYILNS